MEKKTDAMRVALKDCGWVEQSAFLKVAWVVVHLAISMDVTKVA